MDQRKLSDTRDMGDIGLDSGGFPTDYDPKTVRGVPRASSSTSVGYSSQDDVRQWDTQGDFDMPEAYRDEDGEVKSTPEALMNVFSEVVEAPEDGLEPRGEPVTDGGVPNGSLFYREEDEANLYGDEEQSSVTDGGKPTMSDADHEGPYSEFDEGGAPW